MLDINYQCGTRIVMNDHAQTEVAHYVKTFGGTRVLILYGGGHAVRSGLLEQTKEVLTQEGISFVEVGGVVPNPHLELVREAISVCRENQVDFILAVGGGSVIDSAKAIAVGVPYDGDVWDFYAEENGANTTIPQKALPIGVILTMAATGSESSNGTVLSDAQRQLKRSFDNDLVRPVFALENPRLMMSLSPFQTFCGLVDILSHSMERYFTRAGTENELTDRLAEAIFHTCIHCGHTLAKDWNDVDARAELMLASGFSHNNLTGIGRGQDWASHHIAHELSGIFDVTHGAALAIILPAWMKYVNHANPAQFVKWAVRVMDVPESENTEAVIAAGIQRFEDFITSLHLPVRISQSHQIDMSKIDDAMLRRIATQVRKTNGDGTCGGVMKLGEEDIFQILKLAL